MSVPLNDSAWHTVWLMGDWEQITGWMSQDERELVADCVARTHAALHQDGGQAVEPQGLRWWREDREITGDPRYRFFVDWGRGEVEVSKEEFVRAEREAGFRNRLGHPDEPATGGFSNTEIRGRVSYVRGADR